MTTNNYRFPHVLISRTGGDPALIANETALTGPVVPLAIVPISLWVSKHLLNAAAP